MDVDWNTGSRSTIEWAGTAGSGPVVFGGRVVSGLFKGQYAHLEAVSTKQGLSDILKCGVGATGFGGYDSGAFTVSWGFIYGPGMKTVQAPQN